MITIYTYKLQGNGTDSWHVDVHDVETEAEATLLNRISREIVFEDPSIVPVENEAWTIELIDAQSVNFYAPYDLTIESVTNVLNSPTIQIKDDNVNYTLGSTIVVGSKITINVNTASVVNLNITY
jgi:hypothetical protein